MADSRSRRQSTHAPHADVRVPDTLGLRLLEARSEAELCHLLIEEAAQLLGAQRVLLVLDPGPERRIAGAKLPHGEYDEDLLRAIGPWLDEPGPSLRHGPQGVSPSLSLIHI